MRILVLLSTYNGEIFIREQLDSILGQKNVEVDILVRDDGSDDNTLKILQEYRMAYKGQITIVDGSNVGAANSFMQLLKYAKDKDYDYYALSDQDDVWLADKMNAAIQMCSTTLKIEKPTLYFGRYQMVDSCLNKIETPWQKPKISFGHALVDNVATGCTMVFNRSLLLKLCEYEPDYLVMHDDWIFKVCVALGGDIYYDENPMILYRQHSHNVIGGIGDAFFKRWFQRIRKIFARSENKRFRIAQELVKGYYEELPDENQELLLTIVNYKKGFNRLKAFLNPQLCGQNVEGTLRAKFMILFSKF